MNELNERSNQVNAVKESSSDGTVPVKELKESDKAFKAVNEPSSDGTVPLNALL